MPNMGNIKMLINSVRFQNLIPSGPLDTLPILEKYRRERFRARLNGMHVLFVQHHLAPFVARLNAMYKDGLNPTNSWFIDIPYSTNRDVRSHIYGRVNRKNFLEEYCDPFRDYNVSQAKRVKRLLRKLAGQPCNKGILILDDGAYVLKMLASPRTSSDIRERFRNARVVEQTTRGYRFLESAEGQQIIHQLGIVAVSIARSLTKLIFEAPSIGIAVGHAVNRAIKRRHLEPSRTLIIGFGSIGSATANALKRTYPKLQIDVIDSSRDRVEIAGRKFRPFPSTQIPVNKKESYDLVVGCTGGTNFTKKNLNLLSKVAFLASGSSAAVEFDRAELVKEADRDPDDDFVVLNNRESDQSNIHADIRFKYGKDRKFTILNAGFPVNFDGRPEHIPTLLIQPTHCLLYAAVVQAMSLKSPGLRLLDPSDDYWILQEAEKGLTRTVKNIQGRNDL